MVMFDNYELLKLRALVHDAAPPIDRLNEKTVEHYKLYLEAVKHPHLVWRLLEEIERLQKELWEIKQPTP